MSAIKNSGRALGFSEFLAGIFSDQTSLLYGTVIIFKWFLAFSLWKASLCNGCVGIDIVLFRPLSANDCGINGCVLCKLWLFSQIDYICIFCLRLSSISMTTAAPESSPGRGRAALVEECRCPSGYSGTSCEVQAFLICVYRCIPGSDILYFWYIWWSYLMRFS